MVFLGIIILAVVVVIVGLDIRRAITKANLIAVARIEFEVRNANWDKEREDNYKEWLKNFVNIE